MTNNEESNRRGTKRQGRTETNTATETDSDSDAEQQRFRQKREKARTSVHEEQILSDMKFSVRRKYCRMNILKIKSRGPITQALTLRF